LIQKNDLVSHGLDHGITLAIVLPGVMNATKIKRREKFEFEKRHFCHFPFSILHSQLLKS